MKLLKTSTAILGITLFVAGCQKTETNNVSTENTTVTTENSATTENAAAENTAAENVATGDNEIAPSNATGNGTKDDTGPRH